jgi:predicted DNA-binding transcriptional regulator AlpA
MDTHQPEDEDGLNDVVGLAAGHVLLALSPALSRIDPATMAEPRGTHEAPQDDRKLRVTQAAAAIGVHKRTLYGWIKRGLVETQRLPNGTMVVVMASIYRPMEGGAHGEQGR